MKIVGIGASAGGLEAFTELLRNLPTKANVAYVLVQHLDPTHRSLLSELLGRTTPLPVQEITPRTHVAANQIYVIPPNCDLSIRHGVLSLTPRRKNSGPARTIDHFLESLAADQQGNAIGVILSGAGSDGARGLAAIKEAGGVTFAQDQASSKYDSMPRSAIATGCVDFVLPPEKIALEIAQLLAQPRKTKRRAAANARQRRSALSRRVPQAARSSPNAANGSTKWPPAPEDLNLRKIFVMLRTRTGTDFSFYRPNTIRRRLARRLGLLKLKGLERYVRYLREHPTEIDALYQDLLINVTSFFRNPAVFETLKKKIFPRLVKNRAGAETLRIWVAGCSTGQEAYSIAMAYAEFAEQASVRLPVQVFATDVNAAVLEQARAARYTKSQVETLSAARLARFFQKEPDGYRLLKTVRDSVIFAQQNLLTDPPFTRVDLISCRNMLIYLEPALQQKIIPTFHYALKPHGFLLLGSSESVGGFNNLFESVEKTHKLYAKKPAASWLRYERPPTLPAARPPNFAPPLASRVNEVNPVDAFKEADRVTLAKYAPVGVLVNADGEILQFRGDAQRYLELPSGKANFNLVKMAREGLSVALQKALQRAKREAKTVREKDVRLGGRRGSVNLEIVPLKNLPTRCFLILFEPVAPRAVAESLPARTSKSAGKATPAELRQLAQLKRDCAEARANLESLREEHDTSVEELQASNEEVQSANEELQSLNEELETSNEELESANEELTTLNEELATRNTELRESEQRLREQAQLLELAPVLARSPKERVIFWNRGAEKLYGFTRDEALGQTAHLLLAAQFPEPIEKIHALLHRHGHWEGEVYHRRKDGQVICVATQWVLHHDAQNKVRAILQVDADVTARKRAEKSLRESEEFNRRILESSPDCIVVLDLDARVVFMSPMGQALMEISDFGTVAQVYWPGFWDGEGRTNAENAHRMAAGGQVARFRGLCRTHKGDTRWWDVVVCPIHGSDGKPQRILAAARDVTEQKAAEQMVADGARLAELRADIASAVARPGERPVVLQTVADLLVQRLDAACAHIWSFNPGTSLLELQAGAGSLAHAAGEQARIKLGELKIGRIAANRKPYLTNEASSDPEINAPAWVRRERLVGFAGYPLLFEGRLLGVIALFAKQKFEPRVLTELGLTADSIAQFIDRKNNEDERSRLLQEALTARNEALAASRAKDDFLAALSHELRTPLNPVLMLASDGADNPELPESVRQTFKTIATNVSLEARLIDDLLDLTRIAHGKLSLEMKPVDVHAVLRDAVGVVSGDADMKQIHLSAKLHAPRATVIGDAVRLQQVFWNVLNNAVKFTPPGGAIDVVTEFNAAGDRLVVRVTDNGIGLSQSDLARIFSAFSQGDHRFGGLGLGLAISRQLLEKHGGEIRAVSGGPRQGSTFEVDLPLAREPVLPIVAAPRLEAAGEGAPPRREGPRLRRVLLIEDHAATRSSLAQLLTRRGFTVTTAACAAEARALVEQQTFDLVISDLGLPDGDGCLLWPELAAKQPHLVGIALSGYGMESDIARSKACGFAEHLTKPVNIKLLDRVIVAVENAQRVKT